MAEKDYIVEGRRFFSERDYARAKRDKEKIDSLRQQTDFGDRGELEKLRKELREEKHRFLTILGRDFLEEVEMLLKKADRAQAGGKGKKKEKGRGLPVKTKAEGRRPAEPEETKPGKNAAKNMVSRKKAPEPEKREADPVLQSLVAEELKKREKRRKLMIALCSAAALWCLGYFGVYSYYNYRTEQNYREMSILREKAIAAAEAAKTPSPEPAQPPPMYTLDQAPTEKEVLEEYKNLLIKNKKLIGWIKIDDTNIDYPVMQTTDNEYYLDHNTEQEYDKNGAIFMDKDCDVIKPSTNYILYGHHMLNGKMFGKLYLYQKESYYKEHPYINFDTIYEKGTYQVMYVFRSKVYMETEIAFKYYQFIDANSAQEFDSNMQEMAEMSLYDTGVTARYGDQLLTLSTCDNQSTDGRFVVVAKKIAKE